MSVGFKSYSKPMIHFDSKQLWSIFKQNYYENVIATNCKQCFITHYQPHCHPTTKSLWLCSSVYSAAAQISSYMVVGRSHQPTSAGTGKLAIPVWLTYRHSMSYRLQILTTIHHDLFCSSSRKADTFHLTLYVLNHFEETQRYICFVYNFSS